MARCFYNSVAYQPGVEGCSHKKIIKSIDLLTLITVYWIIKVGISAPAQRNRAWNEHGVREFVLAGSLDT